MSYGIEYRYVAKRIAGTQLSDNIDRYVVFVEAGDNNCYDENNRRARKWQVQFIGSHDDIMEMAVRFSGACEGGGLKPLNKHCTPEAYIRRIRRLLDNAGLIEDTRFGEPYVTLEYQCDIGSEDDKLLTSRGFERTEKKKYWQDHNSANFEFSRENRAMFKEFFDVFPEIYKDRSGWHFATCSNPR